MRIRAALAILALLSLPLDARAGSLKEEMAEVVRIRGLEFRSEVEQKTIGRNDLRGYLKREIAKSLGSTEDYATVLQQMQLVESDPKLIEKLLDLYEAQVLAFYDPEEHVYYSLDKPPAGFPMPEAMERYIVIHELVHALQDQQFAVGEKMALLEKSWDREIAYHAVMEGEATLVMMAALLESLGQSFDVAMRQSDIASTLEKAAQSNFTGMPEEAPRFFVESMKFPYLQGLRFVIEAYNRGGWKAIDAIHAAPPISSEEVLHPEIYLRRIAAGSKAPGARELREQGSAWFITELGEFFWRHLLDEKSAEGADRSLFSILRSSEGRFTNIVESTWDTPADAAEFEASYCRFLESRGFKPESKRKGTSVRVVYGDDAKAARKATAR